MNEYKLAICICLGMAALGLFVPKLSGINASIPKNNAIASQNSSSNVSISQPNAIAIAQTGVKGQPDGQMGVKPKPQPLLRLTITVDDPSHLKVKEGEEIRIGQIIADNSIERERLKNSVSR
ncbi:MAG: hypothetical protein HC903_27060 [Methylacidiphilales bacterium]|nr:hypothetical protein [Candidatus Methylacidiphilales bacterium]